MAGVLRRAPSKTRTPAVLPIELSHDGLGAKPMPARRPVGEHVLSAKQARPEQLASGSLLSYDNVARLDGDSRVTGESNEPVRH